MLKKFDKFLVTWFKKVSLFIEQFSPIAVILILIYCLLNKIPLTYDGLTSFVLNCDLTYLIVLSLLLLFPAILFISSWLSNEPSSVGIILIIVFLFQTFIGSVETDSISKITILAYGLFTPLKTFIETVFDSIFGLYDKYCKDTAWDRFINKH
jgi:hypothetical protein